MWWLGYEKVIVSSSSSSSNVIIVEMRVEDDCGKRVWYRDSSRMLDTLLVYNNMSGIWKATDW